MAGSNIYFPTMASIRAMARVQKDGWIVTSPTPKVKMTVPTNMPNFLPCRSAIGANSGLVIPSRERAVINRDILVRSTPKPRAKTGKNGYTILWAVFRMVRKNMKVIS